MRKYFTIYEEAVSHMTLHLDSLNFFIHEEYFISFFQCKCYLASLLTFSLYGEGAGLLGYSQTVLPATLNPAVVRIRPHHVAQH